MAASDIDNIDHLPTVVSPDGSGAYSPSSNSHLKQQGSPCTTQAPSPPIVDYSSGIVADCYSPTKVSQDVVETSAPEVLPGLSQGQGGGPDGSQDERVRPHEALDEQSQQQRYGPEDLQKRVQGLWAGHSTDFETYDACNIQQTVDSPAALGVRSSQPSAVQERYDHHDRSSVCNLASNFHIVPEPDHHQLYYPSRLDLCCPTERSQPGSASYSMTLEDLNRSYQSAGNNYAGFPLVRSSYHYQTVSESLPGRSLSPCSTTLAGAPVGMGREDTAPISDPDMDMDADMDYNVGLYDTEDVLGSPSSAEPSGNKAGEPYAQLIYRAFMSRQNKSMTLQEIYQWFRENTDKAKSEGKGWQNSIRHNLSMNGAFTKRSSKQTSLNDDGSVSLDASAADGRKSTEWFLEPQYYTGVESTTRYRKGNSRGAGRASRVATRLADGPAHSLSRVAAGRKGGYQAAQNRKKVKAEQQHQAARQQGRHPHHHHHHQQQQQQTRLPQRLTVSNYYPGEYYGDYGAHNPHPPPPPHTMSPSPYQAGYGAVPAVQGSLGPSPENLYFDPKGGGRYLGASDCFQPQDLANHNAKRSGRTTLQSGDNDPAVEPATPPGSNNLGSPMEDLSLGSGKQPQQQHYVPAMMTMMTTGGFGGAAGYNQPMTTSSSSTEVAGYGTQQSYSLADAVVYEPPSGHQSPLFADRLTAEDAALFAASAGWEGAGPYYG